MKQKINKKFTLIELIIVVVTISILAGMALPKFIDIKRDAEYAKLLNNIDAVEKSIAICELEKGDYPIYKDKVDFYSLNDVVQAQILANGETGENLYKVRVNESSNKTLSGTIVSKVFAAEEDAALETEEFHTKLKYGLGKYGINDYYIYSKETGNVYYANGDLLDDSQSEITPINKDGTYYMTVNAGDTAQWIDHISNEYIPEGGSITYEWAAFDDPNLKKKNDKLNWTTDFDSLPKTQYLKTKITIKSPENGEQTKLLKYRVQYLTDDIEYDEFEIDDTNIKLDNVIKNSDGSYSSTSSNGGKVSITIDISSNATGGEYSHILNSFGTDYKDITISSGFSGSDGNNNIGGSDNNTSGGSGSGGSNSSENGTGSGSGGLGGGGSIGGSFGPTGSYTLSDISSIPNGPITICIPIHSESKITLPNKLIVIKEKESQWQTIDTLSFECDAMEKTEWVGFDYDGFIPENTRIKVHFSTSDEDSKWSSETDSIENVANSIIIKARIELQKNKYAKQNPTISEVFFDGKVKNSIRRFKGRIINSNNNDSSNNQQYDNIISGCNKQLYVNVNTNVPYNEQDGSKEKPFNNLDTVLNRLNWNDNTVIFLDEGIYYHSERNYPGNVTIIGKNEKTELVYKYSGSYYGNYGNQYFECAKDYSFYNLKISSTGSSTWANYFCNGKSKMEFNNVVFGDLFDQSISIFCSWGDGKMIFNNCTFTKSYYGLFRGDTPDAIELNNCYLHATYSDYGNPAYVKKNFCIDTNTIQLDSNYKIIQDSIDNTKYGVYSGKYAWK